MKDRKRADHGAPATAAAKAKGATATTKKAHDSGPTRPDEMGPDVLEFIRAMDDYRVRHGRPFPSWSEVLDVLRALGYRKIPRMM